MAPGPEGAARRPGSLTVAALASGVEGIGAFGYGVLILVADLRSGGPPSLTVGLALTAVFALIGAGLLVSAVALARGKRRPVAFATVMHAIVALLGLSSLRAALPVGAALVVLGGGGIAALFARSSRRALGTARLPGR